MCFNWDLLSLSGPISVTTDMCQLVLLVISSAFAALATPALLQSLRLASLLQSMASVTQDSPHLPQQCLDLFILSIDVWGPRAGIILNIPNRENCTPPSFKVDLLKSRSPLKVDRGQLFVFFCSFGPFLDPHGLGTRGKRFLGPVSPPVHLSGGRGTQLGPF